MIIGKISKVKGVKAEAKLYKKLPPYILKSGELLQGPKINAHVVTNVGLDKVICKITGEYIDEKLGVDERVLELSVIGSLSKGVFSSGIRFLPLVEANVELISDDEYSRIFGTSDESLVIGNDLYNNSYKVCLDYNKIIASHIGIFGNTGSGKSNTLTSIMSKYLSKLYDENKDLIKTSLILFDLNNEYGSDAIIHRSRKKLYKLSTRINDGDKYPISYSSLSEDQMGILLSATQKTQMPVVKQAMRNLKDEFSIENRILGIKWAIVNGQRQVIYSLRNELSEFVKGLEKLQFISGASNSFIDATRTTFNGVEKRYHFINDVDDPSLADIEIATPTDFLSRFKFEMIYAIVEYLRKGNNFEFVRPLISRMNSRISDFRKVFIDTDNISHEPLEVIQLANLNKDIREIVPSMIAGIIFDDRKRNDRENGIETIQIIVIDEAHNILYSSKESDDVASNNVDVFDSIIKEGRKFGLFLWIASQRPSDISNTITSQVHNYFIHKLVNNNDVQSIRKVVPYMDESTMSMISVLGPGECIISGPSIDNPVYTKIEKVDDDTEPKSRNVKLFGENGILEV